VESEFVIMRKSKTIHKFIDESGDPVFYNSKGIYTVGTSGVSKSYGIGLLTMEEDCDKVRKRIIKFQEEISNSIFLDHRIEKRISSRSGFFFHCSDDTAEIRRYFFNYIRTLNCSFKMIVARKIQNYYDDSSHNFQDESNFYSVLLSHLLKGNLQQIQTINLNISERGRTTNNKNIDKAIQNAINLIKTKPNLRTPVNTVIKYRVQKASLEPLLSIVDYFCWAVQRVFEKGEIEYFDMVRDKVYLVYDIYDTKNYSQSKNYYTLKNPLTSNVHIK